MVELERSRENRKLSVFCQTRFVSFHYWPDAPDEHKFLSYPHRHEFHVKVSVRVDHGERDVEFCSLKNLVDTVIKDADLVKPQYEPMKLSCEDMAIVIDKGLRQYNIATIYVEVSEDGENGGRIEWYNV